MPSILTTEERLNDLEKIVASTTPVKDQKHVCIIGSKLLRSIRALCLSSRLQEALLMMLEALEHIHGEVHELKGELADLRHTARFGALPK